MADLIPTCDLCDAHKGDTSGAFRVLPPVFQSYGGRAAFAGTVVTVKCFEDNTSVKALLEGPGQGFGRHACPFILHFHLVTCLDTRVGWWAAPPPRWLHHT